MSKTDLFGFALDLDRVPSVVVETNSSRFDCALSNKGTKLIPLLPTSEQWSPAFISMGKTKGTKLSPPQSVKADNEAQFYFREFSRRKLMPPPPTIEPSRRLLFLFFSGGRKELKRIQFHAHSAGAKQSFISNVKQKTNFYR